MQLLIEADKARGFGQIFMAGVFESLARVLPLAPDLLQMLETWPGNLADAGLIFRLNAGLHALARGDRHPGLAAIYRGAVRMTEPDPLALDLALTIALCEGEDTLRHWLSGPTQTNEVARIAGLAALLLELDARRPMETELLELGASAGLNLNLARYDIRLGGGRCGEPGSPVQIAPRWLGPTPPAARLRLGATRGVDLNPLDVREAADSERLQAYIWPGEPARSARLQAAITLAHRHPPQVARGRAGSWLGAALAEPQADGVRRVVFHSMVLQYLPPAERETLAETLAAAGAAATPARPLVRVGLEWNDDRSRVDVTATQWHGGSGSGQPVIVAHCHPYAEWFEWRGLPD
ncbi:DUF2332 domain-containing protein [Novosphingobium piscinae]|uniref:DUF2332 family protein n=1 Tax=Novosphingobium piscinae TaxID=1507448 RepID=A0A7X1FVN7_9SPHN|nr:DUF2332 family protein [Novosphingobium piscinae]MBC2667801.1 DUF2332 family protein [Novosphingobium piscinae]